MTVQQLIDQLSKCNPKLTVVIQGMDPTDWTYYNDIQRTVEERNEYLTEDDENPTRVVVIDGGIF